jgi:hypothetical protein
MRNRTIKQIEKINSFFAKGNYFLAQKSYNENRKEINELVNMLLSELPETYKSLFNLAYTLGQFEIYYLENLQYDTL